MDRNDAAALQRRKRINRIKMGIIWTIAVWMLLSMLAIIVLSVQCVRLENRLDQLNGRMEQLESGENKPEDSQNSSKSNAGYEHVVTGIDTPDNMAAEGDEHLVYLTFDESPGGNTDTILNILKEYDVKATFFVVGDESGERADVYRRIAEEGHTLGMYSFSNRYHKIYASADAFLEDYEELSGFLEELTGVKSRFYRFPGGSGNRIGNVSMVELVRLLNERDIVYFDWNVSGGDAVADCTAESIISNVTEGVSRYKTSVVLLHDKEDRSVTAESLGPLIEALQQMDARILPIDENTKVIQYIKADSVE